MAVGVSSYPIIAFAAAEWLALRLKSDMYVFEWGSGVSTLYWAEHVGEVISVEHDGKWYRKVTGMLDARGLVNCELKFIPPEELPSGKRMAPEKLVALATRPAHYVSRHFPSATFENYVKYIDVYPDNYFDVVFVDGRSRASCIVHAVPKVRPGGYLILDNAKRSRYQVATRDMKRWDRIAFFSYGPTRKITKWTTTIWTKPVEGSDS